jgi:hypothetical protein
MYLSLVILTLQIKQRIVKITDDHSGQVIPLDRNGGTYYLFLY